ncbi:MAG: peptidoglycan DD-metalloendopeptidase family protein, partial [Oceanobacter sp.]
MTSKNNHSPTGARNLPLVTIVMIVISLAGCSSNGGFVSVEEKFSNDEQVVTKKTGKKTASGNRYRIKKGDTLYSIAWRYGVDYLTLAEKNGIQSPYTIYPGQEIDISGSGKSVSRPPVVVAKNTSKSTVSKPTPVAPKIPVVTTPVVKTSPNAPVEQIEFSPERWIWPTDGKITARFSTNKPVSKGIDIDGSLGESVLAAAAGTVVYAGRGLRGYGNLVIVKHDDAYLSAYAHTDRILVSEQEIVKAGQKIAEKGSTGTDEVKLHF